ncbi:MAG: hypothetical protein LBN95_12480 [Prevotellaceae bacterium]|jgi:hypothetical protein|nr:hypothetical protein [Prevotellaceae bacterium]
MKKIVFTFLLFSLLSCKKEKVSFIEYDIDNNHYAILADDMYCLKNINNTGSFYAYTINVISTTTASYMIFINDYSLGSNTCFNIPDDVPLFVYTDLQGNGYVAKSGYMTLVKKGEFDKYDFEKRVEVEGTFEALCVNYYSPYDTIQITNGKYRQYAWGYSESYHNN